MTMLHVTPEYIVVVSNPAEIIVDEDASEIILQLRGYIAAKRTRAARLCNQDALFYPESHR